MQFVPDGPDVPELLLDAHEDGRLVFFCGAGISYPAGLPGFAGLVDKIYDLVGTIRDPIEEEAYKRGQFDATLDLLERRLLGKRTAVRNTLQEALKPKLRRRGATDTHNALLRLSRNQVGELRLVTTNFDRIFEHVATREKQPVRAYIAPMLPIPKNSRWDGLVYLHGLLSNDADETSLQRLVITSGDFGLAYLTERWAARFVSELFRSYVVCFVGYSISDPVLRYMMDAIAADRILGELTPQAYAFGDYAPGHKNIREVEWRSKGVTPILYEKSLTDHHHAALHNTLRVWADTYCDGVLGRERIVVDNALARPSASSVQDDFVSRMLWALSHTSGLPAERFADFNPVPSLEWLDALSTQRYQEIDLGRFGVRVRPDADAKLRFGILSRPASYHQTPWMKVVTRGVEETDWDPITSHLARWLVRHLNDPKLILWLSDRGNRLHSRFVWLLEGQLDRFKRLETEGRLSELAEIQANAPNAIPNQFMSTLWRLFLAGRVRGAARDPSLFQWTGRLTRDGLTPVIRMELRELLAPKILLKTPILWGESVPDAALSQPSRRSVDWELVLAVDHVRSAVGGPRHDLWESLQPQLMEEFQRLLRDALDLLYELGAANSHDDRSCWDLPSIDHHWQNRGFRDWVVLIELLRDCWIALLTSDPPRATKVALQWFSFPYPTFKRLALFAACKDDGIATETWVAWLLDDQSWWLWSDTTRRETIRLLVTNGPRADDDQKTELETAILKGPPRSMYQSDIDPIKWVRLVDRSVWLLLAKLRQAGITLGDQSQSRLESLENDNPYWRLAGDERDEFCRWITGSGDPDYEASRALDIAPRRRKALVQWLTKQRPDNHPFYEDTWFQTCRNFPMQTVSALVDLASENVRPTERWNTAFYAWSERCSPRWTWRCVGLVLQSMPDEFISATASALTFWLERVSRANITNEAGLLDVCNRVTSYAHRTGRTITSPITDVFNDPVGRVTQILLNRLFKRKPGDGDGLPSDIGPAFNDLCVNIDEQFRSGRMILASQAIALFRVDRAWTERYMLPLFDWDVSPLEAGAIWQGFLWSPRLYAPLLATIKKPLLEAATRYRELGEEGARFASYLTYVALENYSFFSQDELQAAFQALPQDGLQEAAEALRQALEAAGDRRGEYLESRIRPFWQRVWPKSHAAATSGIAEAIARLSVVAKEGFPSALATFENWLKPIEHSSYIVSLLDDSELPRQFPSETLSFLNLIIDVEGWAPARLSNCLSTISSSNPERAKDWRYQRLSNFSRARSG